MHVHARQLSPWWSSLGRLVQDAAACLSCGSLPGTQGQGRCAHGYVCAQKWGDQCQVPVDGLPGTSAAGEDTVLVSILQQTLPGRGQVGLHLSGTAQICRIPTDPDVFWFICYLPEPRELGFPLHCIKWEELLYRWKWQRTMKLQTNLYDCSSLCFPFLKKGRL